MNVQHKKYVMIIASYKSRSFFFENQHSYQFDLAKKKLGWGMIMHNNITWDFSNSPMQHPATNSTRECSSVLIILVALFPEFYQQIKLQPGSSRSSSSKFLVVLTV